MSLNAAGREERRLFERSRDVRFSHRSLAGSKLLTGRDVRRLPKRSTFSKRNDWSVCVEVRRELERSEGVDLHTHEGVGEKGDKPADDEDEEDDEDDEVEGEGESMEGERKAALESGGGDCGDVTVYPDRGGERAASPLRPAPGCLALSSRSMTLATAFEQSE
jgi:hypothetical protein